MPENITLLKTDSPETQAVTLQLIRTQDCEGELPSLTSEEKVWVSANNFTGSSNTFLALPDKNGGISKYLIGVGDKPLAENDQWWLASVCEKLPAGTYRLSGNMSPNVISTGAIGWCLSQHQYTR